jgi:two-component sensor histidine kinase
MVTDSATVQALQEADGRVRSMLSIYDRLYRSDKYDELNSTEYISALLADISRTWETPDKHITLIQEIESFSIHIRLSFPLGIILNELLSNAYKYAFPNHKKGTIWVKMNQVNQQINVSISNDGVAMAEDVDLVTSSSFGLSLVRLMANQIESRIEVTRENGTAFHFTIPV